MGEVVTQKNFYAYRRKFQTLSEEIKNFLVSPEAYQKVSFLMEKAGLEEKHREIINLVVIRLFIGDLSLGKMSTVLQNEYGFDAQKSYAIAEGIRNAFEMYANSFGKGGERENKPNPSVPKENVVDLAAKPKASL